MLQLELNQYGLALEFLHNSVYLNWITLGIIGIVTLAYVVYKKSA